MTIQIDKPNQTNFEQGFEWDPNKNKMNLEKHGICFEDATKIFRYDCYASPDLRYKKEERIIAIGRVYDQQQILVVVYTKRKNKRRVISARSANKKEKLIFVKLLEKLV